MAATADRENGTFFIEATVFDHHLFALFTRLCVTAEIQAFVDIKAPTTSHIAPVADRSAQVAPTWRLIALMAR